MSRKLIFAYRHAIGDVLWLTAAVRDLHRCYPGQFITDVRTPWRELWEYNPYLTPLAETDPEVEIIKCKLPSIHKLNRTPCHVLHAFIDFINQRLKLNIQPQLFRPDIHLLDAEHRAPSQVQVLTGEDTPFWLIDAGGKYDCTIKWWSAERYQSVVDHFRGKIAFVQVGAGGDHHPRLDGVIDLRGQTSLRQLLLLVHHAQGVLCPVTSLMHMAAAVPTRPGAPHERPCVVVAGGREPPHWEAYPNHQFIHTVGTLPCCASGGCWRWRTKPLGDGQKFDRPNALCVNVAGDLPRCMDLITADEVIRRIELYFRGGTIQYLTPPQYRTARKAIDKRPFYSYDLILTPYTAKEALDQQISRLPAYPKSFHGRGIVMCGGGPSYLPPAWVCINMLRKLGCELPIQLWHLGADEMDDCARRLLGSRGVDCVDATLVRKRHPTRLMGGYELKPYSILHSPFREVLFLDADNVPVMNPEFLFETPEYKRTGVILWPDIRRWKRTNPIWRFTDLPYQRGWESESGQMVFDKERCWRPLALAQWLNEHSDFYYQYILGDKDTFTIAFRKLSQPYAMVPRPVHRLLATMCQHDFNGRRIFQHRNLDKWNIWLWNRRIKGFFFEEECREFVRELRDKWDGGMNAYRSSLGEPAAPLARVSDPPTIAAVMISPPQRDQLRRKTLENLARTDWGNLPIQVFREPAPPTDLRRSINEKTRKALAYGLKTRSDYILYIEDDIIFNRHIKHNLHSWAPLRNGEVTMASLYNPDMVIQSVDGHSNYHAVHGDDFFGAQAVLLSRAAARLILDHWDEEPGFCDVKFSRLAQRLRRPILVHMPSLVQHVGRHSVWGGPFHQACDFDPSWRAPALPKPQCPQA